jgi:hypothetical protein
MILEERLGQDGARASCIKVTGDATVYGQNTNVTPNTCSSSTGYGKVSACSTAALCFAWPQTSGASWSCQVAVYASSGTAPKLLITRNEYTVPLGGSASAGATIPMTTDTVNFQVPALTNNNWVTAPGDYKWIRSLPVTITATQVRAGPFSQQIELHPVATDPGGAAALVTSSGSPC